MASWAGRWTGGIRLAGVDRMGGGHLGIPAAFFQSQGPRSVSRCASRAASALQLPLFPTVRQAVAGPDSTLTGAAVLQCCGAGARCVRQAVPFPGVCPLETPVEILWKEGLAPDVFLGRRIRAALASARQFARGRWPQVKHSNVTSRISLCFC